MNSGQSTRVFFCDGSAGVFIYCAVGGVTSSQSGLDFLAVSPPPLLQVDKYDGEHVIVYWPVEAYEWGLVSKDSLSASAWEPSTNEIIYSADWFNVLRPVVEDDEYYGLKLELP
mgnify:CR=1 FL=1